MVQIPSPAGQEHFGVCVDGSQVTVTAEEQESGVGVWTGTSFVDVLIQAFNTINNSYPATVVSGALSGVGMILTLNNTNGVRDLYLPPGGAINCGGVMTSGSGSSGVSSSTTPAPTSASSAPMTFTPTTSAPTSSSPSSAPMTFAPTTSAPTVSGV